MDGQAPVVEADESDRSFALSAQIGVITTIEPEHLENYDGRFENRSSFEQYLHNIRDNGLAVLGVDSPIYITRPILSQVLCNLCSTESGFFRLNLVFSEGHMLCGPAKRLAPREIHPQHREAFVADSLAAIAVGMEVGPSFRCLSSAEFVGEPSLPIVGLEDDILVVDDYAHHPTEIKATLNAARSGWQRRIIAAFQPHRYSRTHFLFDQFGPVFAEADEIILTDIYSPPPEKPIVGVTSERLAQLIEKESGKPVHLVRDPDELVDFATQIVQSGDLFITMGAGDITKAARELVRRLAERQTSKVI